jgi:YD repeat-containing protein
MPERSITVNGQTWRVSPSGYVTQYDRDEFGLIFTRTVPAREVRVTRYSPLGARSREQSFAELSEADLQRLFAQSQPSATSPEAHYAG